MYRTPSCVTSTEVKSIVLLQAKGRFTLVLGSESCSLVKIILLVKSRTAMRVLLLCLMCV